MADMKIPPVVWVIVVAVGLLLAYNAGWFKQAPQASTAGGGATTSGGTTTVTTTLVDKCPTNQQTTLKTRVLDPVPTVIAYLSSAEAYFKPDDGTGLKNDTTTATTGVYTSGITVTCGKNFNGYILSRPNVTNGVDGVAIKADEQEENADFTATANSRLRARVVDLQVGTASYMYFNDVGAHTPLTGGLITGYSILPAQVNTTSANATVDTGASGYQNLLVYFKTNNTNTRFGIDGKKCAILLDSNTASWQKPDYIKINGVDVVENKAGIMLGTDASAASNYEYAYEFAAPIKDTTSTAELYIKAASGVDPAAADDLIIRFVCQGYYKASRTANAVNLGYFKDDATYSEVIGESQTITIDEVA